MGSRPADAHPAGLKTTCGGRHSHRQTRGERQGAHTKDEELVRGEGGENKMTQEELLLKWNDHHASFFMIVEDLCRTEQLCDVTLACGGQVFETHKLILSVCSPYFRTLLNSRPDKHPIVYLKDVNPKHLEQLLSYMYRGEINVLQEDLGPLIETARGLQIKGLADAGESNSRKEPKTNQNGLPSHPLNQPKRSRTSTPTPAP